MSGILSPEGKISTILNTIGDLIVLNLLTILCSIPIFTFGAAFTSMYQIVLKIVKKEEGHIVSSYFSAFRENFRKSTAIWLIGGSISLLIGFDIFLLYRFETSGSQVYRIVLLVLMITILLFTFFALVTSAYFENTLKNTMINGIKFCVIHILVSILLFALTVVPFLALYLTFRVFILLILLGFSGPAFLCALYFSDLFRQYEPEKKGDKV